MRLSESYRAAARKRLALIEDASVETHAAVAQVPYPRDGAYVECQLFVPAAEARAAAEEAEAAAAEAPAAPEAR